MDSEADEHVRFLLQGRGSARRFTTTGEPPPRGRAYELGGHIGRWINGIHRMEVPMTQALSPTTATPARVLVVEDDLGSRILLRRILEGEGHTVEEVGDGDGALDAVRRKAPDLVILDLGIPGVSGLDVLREVRKHADLPVIVVTGRAEEQDRVLGLGLGADDYVTKPYFPGELAARVSAVLRRARHGDAPAKMEFDGLVIDPGTREVLMNAAPVDLTAREFDLLMFLAASPRRAFTREELLRNVWGSSSDWQDASTITEHVRRIRIKIEDGGRERIATVRGVGYRFEP